MGVKNPEYYAHSNMKNISEIVQRKRVRAKKPCFIGIWDFLRKRFFKD
jgi:hypothetical protein